LLAWIWFNVANTRRLAMAAPVLLWGDDDAAALWRLARKAKDGNQTRGLLALAEIYDGGSRGDAAKIGGVGLPTIRDWVLRFNGEGPEGLIDGKAPGKRPKLSERQRWELAHMVESGPLPAVHGVIRWRLVDLAQWIFEAFGITIGKQTLSRTLRAMGYRKLSARPRHYAQKAGEAGTFKKTSPLSWRRSRARKARAFG
jgi:transposase